MDNEKVNAILELLFEDDPGDADLLKETLCREQDPSFIVENVPRFEEGLARLKSGGVDLVLLDLSLPDSHGFDTFAKVYMAASSLPIVVLTGLDDQSMALEAVKRGAQAANRKSTAMMMKLAKARRFFRNWPHTSAQ